MWTRTRITVVGLALLSCAGLLLLWPRPAPGDAIQESVQLGQPVPRFTPPPLVSAQLQDTTPAKELSAEPVVLAVQESLDKEDDWLLRRPFGAQQSSESRLSFISHALEDFKNAGGERKEMMAYVLAGYCVATELDYQGRTAPPWQEGDPGPAPNEWEMQTQEARYRFAKNEFPAYSWARELYMDTLRTANGNEPVAELAADHVLFPERLEGLVDAFVDRSVRLLTE